MRRALSLALAALLSLTLSLTGAVSMAGIDGDGGITMVICADDGAVTVTIDADGNPVPDLGPLPHCPECYAPTPATLPAVPSVWAGRVVRRRIRAVLPPRLVLPAARRTRPAPRGPPTEKSP